jgi:hypothetical protein
MRYAGNEAGTAHASVLKVSSTDRVVRRPSYADALTLANV